MKSLKLLARFLICIIVCLSLASCNKATPSKKLSPEAEKQARADWNMKTTAEAYKNAGTGNPAWDEFAQQALIAFANARAGDPDGNWGEVIAKNSAAAMNAGCNDPMVRYLYIKYAMDQTGSKEKFADAFCDVARVMEKSSYPTIRKFYASARAVDQLYYTYTNGADRNTLGEMYNNMLNEIHVLVRDKSTPPEEIYQACTLALHETAGDIKEYQQLYNEIEKPLFQNWPEASASWLLKGQSYVVLGWRARGSGYANSVTDEGWKMFSKDLEIAEDAFNHAWKIDPTDSRIPLQMMSGPITGLGRDHDEMELWFGRGMTLTPNNYDLCHSKLYYLEPKWHGSVEEMLAFGRKCVQSPDWGGRVPLILVDAHLSICRYIDESKRTNYWKLPEVWADIKPAYEKFFQLNPNVTGSDRAYYAWYAYQAKDWDKLNELIPKLGPNDYYIFGSKDEFDKMVQLAKEHSSPK